MDRLAELRERRALTLRELAEMSGVAADTINQIELGHRKARPSTLRKLARALEVDVREFFEVPAAPKVAPPGDFDLERMIEELEEAERPRDLTELRELIEERAVPELAKLPRETLEAIESDKRSRSRKLDKRFNSPDMQDPTKYAEMLKLLEEIRTVRLALLALDRVLTEA